MGAAQAFAGQPAGREKRQRLRFGQDPANIRVCLSKGVNVIEQDLDAGIANFADDNFDMVVMTDALQAVRDPRACSGRCCASAKNVSSRSPISVIGAAGLSLV